MMTSQEVSDAAGRLFEAEQSGKQIELLTKQYPEMNLDDSYAVQSALVERKVESGRKVTGWKIGLTSRAMQEALKITTPDSGVLFDDMHFESGDTIAKARFIEPRIEAEIAFVTNSPLKGEDVTREDVLAATDYVCPALEILDTRIVRQDPETGAIRKVFDTISDNAANAGIVMGQKRLAVDEVDLRWTGAIVSRNGVVEETGLGAGVLNDPVTSVMWLVHRLAEYGDGVDPGQVILSGSFIRPIEAPSGSSIQADFGTFGEVNCDFA